MLVVLLMVHSGTLVHSLYKMISILNVTILQKGYKSIDSANENLYQIDKAFLTIGGCPNLVSETLLGFGDYW